MKFGDTIRFMSRRLTTGGRKIVLCPRILLLGLVSCAGLSHTVDRELLRDITIENKLMLFDAENDVAIALDEREQLVRQVRDLRVEVREVLAQIREAQSDEERALAKNEAEKATLAARAEEVFELQLTVLGARIDLAKDRLQVQERLLRVAEAKFELAKAKLCKRNNVFGAAELELEDFEQQVRETIDEAREASEDLSDDEKALAELVAVWQQARADLMKASGGGVGSPWAEGSAAWGNW